MAALGHCDSPTMAQRRERSTGSPSGASPGRGRWCGDPVMVVKKWQWRHSVRAMLGRGEKTRRMGRGAVEDGKAVEEELGGGGTQPQRREERRGAEESGDECSEGRVRASTGGRWRRRGLNGRRQCRAFKTLVTRTEGGGGDLRPS
jgi:hypothetical protein